MADNNEGDDTLQSLGGVVTYFRGNVMECRERRPGGPSPCAIICMAYDIDQIPALFALYQRRGQRVQNYVHMVFETHLEDRGLGPSQYSTTGENTDVLHKVMQTCSSLLDQCRRKAVQPKKIIMPLITAKEIQESSHPDIVTILKETVSVIVWTLVFYSQYSGSFVESITLCANTDLEEKLLLEVFQETEKTMENKDHPAVAIYNDMADLLFRKDSRIYLYYLPTSIEEAITRFARYIHDGFPQRNIPRDGWEYHLQRVVHRNRNLAKVMDCYLHPDKALKYVERPWVATTPGRQQYKALQNDITQVLQTLFDQAVGLEGDVNALLLLHERFDFKEDSKLASLLKDYSKLVHIKRMLKARIAHLVYHQLRKQCEHDFDAMLQALAGSMT